MVLSKQDPKLWLNDGTFELFRSYYAGVPGKTADGIEVGATVGVIRSIASLLKKEKNIYIGIAFDTVIESFRNELFEYYKTGEGMDPELWDQFPIVERALEAMGIPVWRGREFEADDHLAAAAYKFRKSKTLKQIVIASPDKDLTQMIDSPKIITYDRLRDKAYDGKAVKEKFGVPPSAIADLLALVGDPADGVPGLPGWGMKSASTILRAFGSLEDVSDDIDDWPKLRGAQKLYDTLFSSWDDAVLYKTLTTLRTDAPIPETLSQLKWRGVKDEWSDMCRYLGMRAVLT